MGAQTATVPWYREITPYQWKALGASTLGWVLDSMDVYLFILAMPLLLKTFHMSRAVGGMLGTLTLIASAIGGVAFGFIADRFGRTRSMMASILIYSVFTAACGFAQSIVQLGIFRFLLGLGVGGEWSSGAALISETWPEKHRGKAFGIMQSGFALGFVLASAIAMFVFPHWGWRGAFYIGILPALVTVWVRKHVEEPASWRAARAKVLAGDCQAPTIQRPAQSRGAAQRRGRFTSQHLCHVRDLGTLLVAAIHAFFAPVGGWGRAWQSIEPVFDCVESGQLLRVSQLWLLR